LYDKRNLSGWNIKKIVRIWK